MLKALKLSLVATTVAFCSVARAATPISGVTTFTGPDSTLSFGPANGAGLAAFNVFGYDFRLVMNTADPVGLYVGDLAWGTGNGVQYYPNSGAALSMNRFVVASNGGEDFDLKGFGLSTTTMNGTDPALTVVVVGYRDGAQVSTFSRTLSLSNGSVQLLEPFDVSGTPGFTAIDEFSVSPGAGFQIGYLGIDNLEAVNFVPEPSSISLFGVLAIILGWRRRR